MRNLEKSVGGYRILNLVYESRNSSVYRAVRESDRQPVVLKILKQDHSSQSEWNRYKHEYEIIGRLGNVESAIKAYSLEPYRKTLFMVLEDFGAESLRSFQDRRLSAGLGPLPLSAFLDLALQITQGVADIHGAHVIHKDINPSNILYNPTTRQLKLIDFGIATILSREYPTLRNPNTLEGSPAYISPEQTGRMNRAVDYRADLYCLGVTLYEMLTGRLPFGSDDPLSLVHAHMAKAPRPVMNLNLGVPRIVSDIIMRLMAKNAEDRYQSAFGLKADLERCRAALQELRDGEGLEDFCFELGQDDFSGQLHVPQKLYGRSAEIAELLASFDRVAAGSQELMLVAGYAGVGKSALVAEVHKPVTERRGYFINGKFDQHQKNTPYAVFTQAFNQLVELLLIEPKAILQAWRGKILTALDGNGAVLTEVMPSLEKVIGPQPAVLVLGGQENRNRFNLTFQNFAQAVSTAEHPLVLFIDDWQWADLASLELLKAMLTGEKITHLLMIGAYRDNEVDRAHPFMITLNDLTAAGAAVRTIALGNLQPDDVGRLIQDSLLCSRADSQALAELIHTKTSGNAFFTRQFLQNLYEEDWLRFDFSTRRWAWDMAQIRAQDITDNVVELMAGKLKKLSPESAGLLQLAACLGNEFDLRTLALIGQKSASTTLASLKDALIQGLLIPLDDHYRLADTAAQARFSFLHDRVQQAAYAQIPVPEQQAVELRIGRLLLANTPAAELEQRVFDIVQHYDQAGPLISDETERLRLAELNLKAADLAYGAAAFHSARAYLESALVFMPADAWTSRYDWMLRVYSQLATVFSLTGDFEPLERAFQVTEAHAHTMADTARVKQAKIQGLLYRGNYTEAIDLGLTFVEGMGVPINRNPSPEEAFKYLRDTVEWLTEARIQSLLHLPEAPAGVGLILEVASVINGPTYNSNMYLFLVFVSQITRLCVEQGLTPWAPVTLITFTILLSAVLHNIPKARLLTTTTVQLFEERYRSDNPISPLSLVIGGFIVHRYDHLKHTLPVFAEGVQKGLTTGTFQFVGYCAWWQVWHRLFLGEPLGEAEAVSQQAEETCKKIQMGRQKDWCLLVHQAILNLQGKSEVPWILKGDVYDEEEFLKLAFHLNDLADVFRIFFYKAWLHYLFERHQEAVKFFRESESHFLYGSGTYLVPLLYYYDTLANAAVFADHAADEQSRILERISRNLEQFDVWVRHAPMNHQHKKELMEAEKARLEGRYWDAVTLYKKSIQGARDNGFQHEEALAYELCGRFWLDHGDEEIARVHLQKALSLYGSWGAGAKVKHLQEKLGIGAVPLQAQTPDAVKSAINAPTAKPSISDGDTTQPLLDIASLLKANQILSQTVKMADLLQETMKILLENAGAERAFVLYRDEDTWFIEAKGEVGDQRIETGMHMRLSDADWLSMSIFNYVLNSGKVVVLDNASEDLQFGTDAYLRRDRVKSLLCLPVWHKGQLKLILYLENNLTVGAFTQERLEMLRLLSGQMAISMEKVRTEEALRLSEERYRFLFENAPVGMYVSQQRRIIHANGALASMLGARSPEDIIGQDPLRLVRPEEHASAIARAQATIDTSRASPPRDEKYVRLDGSILHVTTVVAPDPLKARRTIQAVILDNTERKRVEDALRQSERRYRNIFENAAVAIREEDFSQVKRIIDGLKARGVKNFREHLDRHPEIVLEAANAVKVVDANNHCVEVYGAKSKDELLGSLSKIFLPETLKAFSRTMINIAEGRRQFQVESANRNLRGERRDVLVNISLPDAESAFDSVLVSTIDITERKRVEQALRESAEQYRIMTSTSMDGFHVTEQGGRFVDVNDALCRMLGYSRDELLGISVAETEAMESREETQRHLLRIAELGSDRFESRNYRKDGRIIDVEVSATFMRQSGRQLTFLRDVTDRKRAEEALRQAILVIENSPAVLFRWRASEGWPVELVSRNVIQFGYTPEELLLGKVPYASMVHPEDAERVSREVREYTDGGAFQFQQEYRLVTKDGQVRWVDDRTVVERDTLGRATNYQGIILDITERRLAEEALRESAELYRILTNASMDGYLIVDRVGRLLDVNDAYCQMMGYCRDELLRMSVPDFEVEESLRETRTHIQRVMESGSDRFETRHRRKDGRILDVEVSLTSFRETSRLLCFLRDVTDRMRAEAELARHRDHLEDLVRDRTRALNAAQEELLKKERLAVLGQLTATVSHELRNPLGVIRSSAFYLQEKIKGGDQKIRKHLDRIESQVDLCDGIVGELLEYTRGSGYEMKEGEIAPWLRKTLEEARGIEGISIIPVLSGDLPKIFFDAGKMGRVMANLIDNATHAVRERAKKEEEKRPYVPKIHVEVARAEGGVVIKVVDNGTGMDQETTRKASEPLFTTKARGTGLGLAIVKKIVEEHGGTLRLESELHRGTKVTLWLPVRERVS